jgi:hypothetical protein
MTNINSMFESIKTAMTKDNSSSRGQFIRTEVGNTYTVRLIPNIKDPNKTFFHYYTHGWVSLETGQYINLISPNTYGERDPIAELRFKALKTGTAEEKAKAAGILRKENWMVNVYVVNDPVKPENNGTIKLLRFGRQLHKIIMESMEGEEAVELGPRIFDLSKNGCDFRIKVEKQGEYPTYVSSKFGMPKEINIDYTGGIDAIHNDVFDLEAVFTVKSYDELKVMLDEHYLCKQTTVPAVATVATTVAAPVVAVTTQPVVESKVKVSETNTTTTSDEDIEALLANLDNM